MNIWDLNLPPNSVFPNFTLDAPLVLFIISMGKPGSQGGKPGSQGVSLEVREVSLEVGGVVTLEVRGGKSGSQGGG